MRYQYVKLTGYIGIYNGLGIEEIEIDFSKSRNNIILICGANGSGKSTLLRSISLFPDSSSMYIPGREARKQLVISDNENIYEINILSPVDPRGDRKVTKVSIKKNGVELNPNGNVNSYKDIIFTEFELDSNFMTLSMLTSIDRGLGDCTPAERKLYVSKIIDNLEIYNDMYKTLNKKSIVYKSHINTLHTKIQNIGNKNNIESTLSGLKQKETELSNKILEYNNIIVSIQAKTTIDSEEAEKYKLLQSELDFVGNNLMSLKARLDSYINKTKIQLEKIDSVYESDSSILKEYEIESEKYKSAWISLSNSLKESVETINTIEAEIESYNDENFATIENNYFNIKKELKDIESKLKNINIPIDINLIYPLKDIIEYFKDIIKYIDSLYDDITIEDINYIVNKYSPSTINILNNELKDYAFKLEESNNKLKELKESMKQISILDYKPKECNIDYCPFIKDAINLKSSLGNIKLEDELSDILALQNDYSIKISEIQEKIAFEQHMSSKYIVFDTLRAGIIKNNERFKLFNIIELTNLDNFYKNLSNLNSFNFIRNPQRLIDGLNLLIEYSSKLDLFKKIEYEFNANREKTKIINSNKSLLIQLKEKNEKLAQDVIDNKLEYDRYNNLVSSFTDKVNIEKEYLSVKNSYNEESNKYSIVSEKINEFDKKASKSLEMISQIDSYKQKIDILNKELLPIKNNISNLSGQLTLLDSYYTEYNIYKQKFDMIETLKKYCSPTGGGIQVLFMQIYMSKTLELSNQILSLLFNGEYRLLDFVINQDEFRIPFIGSGLTVDDISSGSNSQICMMSTIINLVLIYQASTKFNIAFCDEIDSGLSYSNRMQFLQVLDNIVHILGFEQIFLISHSSELTSSNIDIIKLKDDVNYDDIYTGNIIYDYNKASTHN